MQLIWLCCLYLLVLPPVSNFKPVVLSSGNKTIWLDARKSTLEILYTCHNRRTSFDQSLHFDTRQPHHQRLIHRKLTAINSTAHWAHKQELQKKVPHCSQEGSAQKAPSPPHLRVQPVRAQKGPDLSYQHPLHCHQKGSSASHRALQVTLLWSTHTEDQTGTSIGIKIWPHLLMSCSPARVMVSWVSEHE